MNLDLDNPQNFWPIIEKFIRDEPEVVQLCRENTHLVSSICDEGLIFSNLPYPISNAINRFIDAASSQMLSVSSYHGCRVLDENDYRVRGIKRLEKERLVDWCKEFFMHDGEIDRIIDTLPVGYIPRGESGVFCMSSAKSAIKNGCQHSEGSELIRTIARKLGPGEEGRYLSIGRPCFTEVRTPIDWFHSNSSSSIGFFLRDLFVHYLWDLLELDWPGDPRRAVAIFACDVPPEMLHCFHYVPNLRC